MHDNSLEFPVRQVGYGFFYSRMTAVWALLLLALTMPALAQTTDTLPSRQKLFSLARQLSGTVPQPATASPPVWYIGVTDPNEIVTVSDTTKHVGDIVILNGGQLLVKRGTLQLDGNIIVANHGSFEVDSGGLTIIQHYVYEHSATVADTATWLTKDAMFTSSGMSWSIGVARHARYTMTRTTIRSGFITHGAQDSATIEVNDSHFAGEFLPADGAHIHFTRVDTALLWLTLPETSVVDLNIPDSVFVPSWRFASGEPGVQGIPYEMTVDSCSHLMYALMQKSGSSATVRNGTLRVVGMMFTHPDTVKVHNLVNGSFHVDEAINVSDRQLHLINTKVQTWSIYPFRHSDVEISNCIFGEILVDDTAYAVVANSICDGSGGYASAFGHGRLILFATLVQSPVVSRASGLVLGVQSSFLGNSVTADETSLFVLLNTSTLQEPTAYHQAAVIDELLAPVTAEAGRTVPLIGSSRVIAGPDSPIQYQGYEIDGRTTGDTLHTIIVPRMNRAVRSDTLGLWNTGSLADGYYTLRLRLYTDLTGPIDLEMPATLLVPTDVPFSSQHVPEAYSLSNYPNPFNPSTVIRYSIPMESRVVVRIYDVLGSEVTNLEEGIRQPGDHEVRLDAANLSGGVYFCRMTASPLARGENSMPVAQVRKLLLVK